MKLLVVDDERIIRSGIIASIKRAIQSIEVYEADNGESALQTALKIRPDIIITDIRMAAMTGLELSKRVKTFLPKVKIIIVSGYEQFEYAKTAVHIGVSEYLLKPVGESELIEVVLKLKRQIEQTNDERSDDDHVIEEMNDIIKNVMRYVEEHYKEKINLGIMAEQVFVNPNYLCRLFKKETGMTFVDWVNRYRIDRAKHMIKEQPEYKNYEISNDIGFCDYRYFSTLFKRYEGCSISSYRKQLRL